MAFKEILMFDDGNHNDGFSNDGIYGARISNSANVIDYYIYAENDSAGVFSPERAAYEFYTIEASQLGVGNVVINEIMSNNVSTVSGPCSDFDDWIELYNPNSFPISTIKLVLLLACCASSGKMIS